LGRADAESRLRKRSSKEVSIKPSRTITVPGPQYFSNGDEEAFYSWLSSIASVQRLGGVGRDLEIVFVRTRLSQNDLRELIAIFHRYQMDKRVLAQFDHAGSNWFRDPEAYWYADVFGTRQLGAKRR
jgi:hypothetical protein